MELAMELAMELVMEIGMEGNADIHLSLPENLLVGLDHVAQRRGVRRAHLVREVIAEYVDRIEAERLEEEMADYVEALAPYSGEFVAETDAHTVERLLRETEW
jgi:metal-responsive CopG/Arc/MetJ family transcriptional regulator